MSYIPDTRAEYIEPLFAGTKAGKELAEKKEKNPYYEGNLNHENQLVVKGYDFCAEDIKNLLCDPELFDWEECDVKPSDIKAVCKAIYDQIGELVEADRNNLVVSLIEDQPAADE